MRIETVFLLCVTVVAVFVTSANAEYVWNGSEWVWKEKEVRNQPTVLVHLIGIVMTGHLGNSHKFVFDVSIVKVWELSCYLKG
jgi:hypothetical protein